MGCNGWGDEGWWDIVMGGMGGVEEYLRAGVELRDDGGEGVLRKSLGLLLWIPSRPVVLLDSRCKCCRGGRG